MSGDSACYGDGSEYCPSSLKKLRPKHITEAMAPGIEVIICCEMDAQWSYVKSKNKPRWLFYAYDRIR